MIHRFLMLAAVLIVSGCEIHKPAPTERVALEDKTVPKVTGDFTADEARRLLDMPRASPLVLRAPAGFPKQVAAEIISRQSGLRCESVTGAVRVRDGSIVARCAGGETYRVGRLFEMPGQRAMACEDIAPLTQQRPC